MEQVIFHIPIYIFCMSRCLIRLYDKMKGFHRIVSAYASLVRGETIQPIDEKRLSQLVFQTPIEGCETPNQLSEQVYQLTFRHWATGWMGLIFTGLAQWLIKAWSPSERLLRNMHIPPSVIDRLNNLAKQRDLFLTRNDLLMAIIAQVTNVNLS